MTSEWHKSTSDVCPETVDATSSKKYVLVRRNIECVNGMYEYEEKFVDRKDWEVYEDILTVTPYKKTKTAYLGDTEITFNDVPEGNLAVFVRDENGNYPDYTVERNADMITVYFESLEYITTITISIQ